MLLHRHGSGQAIWSEWYEMPFSISLKLMLFDAWIQISILIDLIQDVIDTSVVYFIFCYMILEPLSTLLIVLPVLVWG